jgi:hypothetical protein
VRLLALITVLGIARIGMGMRRLIVAIRSGLVVRVVVLTRTILVMPHSHALRCANRRHPLHGNGDGQQQHGKNAEESSRHRRAL